MAVAVPWEMIERVPWVCGSDGCGGEKPLEESPDTAGQDGG